MLARKRPNAILLLIAFLASAIVTLTGPPASAACWEFKDAFGGTTVVCDDEGNPNPPPASGNPAPPSEPTPCSFAGVELPCTSEHGVWDGRCYVTVTVPQPPSDSPIWLGRTEGIVLTCTHGACVVTGTPYACAGTSVFWAPSPPAGLAVDEPTAARRAIAQLQLTPITITMAPEPDLENPNVLITAPTYFWAEGGPPAVGPLTTTVSQDGISITLSATLDSVDFDTGDGATVTCSAEDVSTPPATMSFDDDPACGHAWARSGTYSVSATSRWSISWQGPSQSGTLEHTLTSASPVAVTDRPVNLVTGT